MLKYHEDLGSNTIKFNYLDLESMTEYGGITRQNLRWRMDAGRK